MTRRDVATGLGVVAKRKPTAVLTSFELPGLSGLVLIAALKSSPDHRAIPIGLVTSSDPTAHHMGAYPPDAVISKDGHLAESVDRFLQSFHVGLDALPKTPSASSARLEGRILLAEDATLIQKLLGKILHVAGADVTVVENGAQAVAAASEHDFDLILMDIEMPEMDGREATRRLRAKGVTVPIIASTAHSAEEFRRDAIEGGFDDVLSKPVDRNILIETCRRYLSGPSFSIANSTRSCASRSVVMPSGSAI
jgi:CheY-like chemotaxis protein